jgi:hypothetical protein
MQGPVVAAYALYFLFFVFCFLHFCVHFIMHMRNGMVEFFCSIIALFDTAIWPMIDDVRLEQNSCAG